jgi:hypothetical protein
VLIAPLSIVAAALSAPAAATEVPSQASVPAHATTPPQAASAASAARHNMVRLPMPALAGTYQLVRGQSQVTDDQTVHRMLKGKLVIEAIDATHLRVLEAHTIKGVGTLPQMDVYAWNGHHFIMVSPFEAGEVEVTGLEQLTLKGDTLVRRISGANFVEDTQWQRVTSLDVYDRWVERALDKARRQCQESAHCRGPSSVAASASH